jgi:hypothetical protein
MILRDAQALLLLIKVLLLYSGPVALDRFPVRRIIIQNTVTWPSCMETEHVCQEKRKNTFLMKETRRMIIFGSYCSRGDFRLHQPFPEIR